jgi:hypothetical protein
MAKRRALKDTVKDPMVRKTIPADRRLNQNSAKGKVAFKIAFSLLIGFAGGLLTGRFLKT